MAYRRPYVVNLLDFGADPVGIADCTASMNAAITSLPAAGGAIYAPAGFYKLVSTITVNKPVKFYGDGEQQSTFLVPAASDGFNLTTTAGVDIKSAIIFEDLAFNTTTGAGATAGAMIHTNSIGNFPLFVNRCSFKNSFYALRLNSSWSSAIRDTAFAAGSASAGAAWIWIHNTVNADQGDSMMEGNIFGVIQSAALILGNAAGWRILSNKFVGIYNYAILVNTPSNIPSDLLIQNNSIEGTPGIAAIDFEIPGGGIFTNVIISENQFSHALVPSILLHPTGNITFGRIVDNLFHSASTGIQFNPVNAGGTNFWYVADNSFYSALTTGIILSANAQNLTIGTNEFNWSGTNTYIGGTASTSTVFNPGTFAYYSQTANAVTVANSFTTLFSSGIGGNAIVANQLTVGKRVRLNVRGFVSVGDGGAGVHSIELLVGGTVIASGTGTFQATLNAPFSVEASLTCRTVGAGGTVVGSVVMEIVGFASFGGNSLAPVVVNTTTSAALDIKYDNGNATGALTATEATIEFLD